MLFKLTLLYSVAGLAHSNTNNPTHVMKEQVNETLFCYFYFYFFAFMTVCAMLQRR